MHRYYKPNRTHADNVFGLASMRKRKRSLFNIFATEVHADAAGIDWMCFTDNDMYVNVPRLEQELADIMAHPPASCVRPDRCAVANVLHWPQTNYSDIPYSGGCYCMRTPTVLVIQKLLNSHTDEQLEWHGNVR